MTPSPYRLLFLALFVCAAAALRAADPTTERPVLFTTLAWEILDPSEELTLNYTHKDRPQSVSILWRERSRPMPIDGPGELTFTRTVTRDGQAVEVPVATARIPEGVSRALLVFGPNPRHGPGESSIRVLVIDDSLPVFPGQSVRLVNYSTMELGGEVGTRAFSVAPGRDQVVPADLPETNRLLPLRLARRDAQGGWKKLRSTGLPMTPDLRVLVFLVDDPARPGSPRLTLIRDTVAPEAPEVNHERGLTLGLRVKPAPH